MGSEYNRYLKILRVSRKTPSIEYLSELLASHIINVPFENISKLYYYFTKGLKTIPSFDLYLKGVEQNNFGGTCYSNNYYFNQLLNHLGFNVWLCGADMSDPDVHLVNVVTFNDKMYLVDVGYGAPFFIPMPLGNVEEFRLSFGNDSFVLLPKNIDGHSELKQYSDDEIKHGYSIKPTPRSIDEFSFVINDSFKNSSTFLNRVTTIKFGINSSISIRNYSLVEINNGQVKKTQLVTKEHIVDEIVNYFSIPKNIVLESVYSIANLT